MAALTFRPGVTPAEKEVVIDDMVGESKAT